MKIRRTALVAVAAVALALVPSAAFAYGAGGQKDRARDLIAGLEADSAKRYVSPFSMAIAYAGIGDHERAIDWLEKARAERSDAMAILKVHPLLLHLHQNRRFEELTKNLR